MSKLLPMAKKALYIREDVINKATKLYWEKGFHATSVRNLQDEINLRSGSFYAAFGSKDGLFTEVLQNYTNITLAMIDKCRRENDSPIASLKAFVELQVIDSIDNSPNSMCMLTKTLSELTSEQQSLLDITKAHIRELTDQFVILIEEAQHYGEVEKSKNAQDLADFIMVQIAGLRTFAKLNTDKSKLSEMIEQLFLNYPFKNN